MRRVLHFKSTYLNPSETFIDRLVRHHDRYEPVVTTVRPRAFTDEVAVHAPAGALKRVVNRAALQINTAPPFLYGVVRDYRPAVLHGHFGLDSYRLLPLARATRTPLLVNFYGYDVVRLPREWGWAARYGRLAARGDYFIVGSDDQRRDILAMGFPPDRVETVKLGLDVESIAFRPRLQAGPRLMLIGRLVEKKGIAYAVEAVGRLRAAGHAVTLDVYGDGPLRAALEAQIAAAGLGSAVTLHGMTDNAAIVAALYSHDVLLVPSVSPPDGDKEGIPQTIVEGMAAGIPVVGTPHAGLPELIVHEETGLLAAERSASELAGAIARYLTTPALVARVSRAGRQAAREKHDIHRMVAQVEGIYDRLVAEGRR